MTSNQEHTSTKTFLKLYLKQLWMLSTPKNISYAWSFGSFLGMVMIIQIVSGILLACYYISGSLGWESVVEISREVNSGWLMRNIHSNMASFVFLVLFIHFFRGIWMSSFYLMFPWMSGWFIMVLTMASAFLGYVLPWGQMSFWGATVIINLLSVLPSGKLLVMWLWGGFYVSSITCSFFFTFHFLIPIIILLMIGIHLILLHNSGSTTLGGLSRFSGMMMKFGHLFSYKDMINLMGLWLMLLLSLLCPDWSSDPVNFSSSDLSNSPVHIQPEWYFLHLYAVLRSIPNKLGGLVGFFMALFILLMMVFFKSNQILSNSNLYNYMSWSFLSANLILLWLGMQPVEDPYVFMGQISTLMYFSFFLFSMMFDMLCVLIYTH